MSASTTLLIFVFWPQNPPKLHNFQPAELVTSDVTASSPLRFLVQKGQLRKVRFFVSGVKCAACLQIRSFSAENWLRAPNSVFCPEKPANSSPLSLSPLVTASSPLAFWVQKCAIPELLGFFAVRQPAEDLARSPTACRRGSPT